ncbi:hemolysin-III related-domain-containing protein [Entophlyctis helioformis]|nr:hemolysin-III related-domain-containing protein [Entophlyctis helioformis]
MPSPTRASSTRTATASTTTTTSTASGVESGRTSPRRSPRFQPPAQAARPTTPPPPVLSVTESTVRRRQTPTRTPSRPRTTGQAHANTTATAHATATVNGDGNVSVEDDGEDDDGEDAVILAERLEDSYTVSAMVDRAAGMAAGMAAEMAASVAGLVDPAVRILGERRIESSDDLVDTATGGIAVLTNGGGGMGGMGGGGGGGGRTKDVWGSDDTLLPVSGTKSRRKYGGHDECHDGHHGHGHHHHDALEDDATRSELDGDDDDEDGDEDDPTRNHTRVFRCKADYADLIGHPTSCINQYTVPINRMPAWYNDNSFIRRGYRRITNSYAGCLTSLFFVHNETGNVYTHLVGALIFLVLVAGFYAGLTVPLAASVGWGDVAAFAAFYAGAIVCLGLSTTFHLCCCHSRDVLVYWNKADYIGIVTLILGSFIPVLYYGFFCYPTLRMVYIPSFSVLAALPYMSVSLMRRFSSPQYRYFRTGIFVALGVSGVVPLTHIVLIHGFSAAVRMFSVYDILLMGALYLVGAFIYAYRIPERWFPSGIFDIWGQSHQIWHLLVLAAALVHYRAVVAMFLWRHSKDASCLVSGDALTQLALLG